MLDAALLQELLLHHGCSIANPTAPLRLLHYDCSTTNHDRSSTNHNRSIHSDPSFICGNPQLLYSSRPTVDALTICTILIAA